MPTNPTPTPATALPEHIHLPVRVNEDSQQIGDIVDAQDMPFIQVQPVGEGTTFSMRVRMRRERTAFIAHCINTLPTVEKERDEAVAMLKEAMDILERCAEAHFADGRPKVEARALLNRLRG